MYLNTTIQTASPRSLKTATEVREEFAHRGEPISTWARANGYSLPLVYRVLAGHIRGLRGQSHDIAVQLGIKNGVLKRSRDAPIENVARDRAQRASNTVD